MNLQHKSSISRTYLEFELATELLDLLRRLFSESPRLTMPLPVIEKCLSL